MREVKDIKVLTVDDKTYVVDQLPEHVQNLVDTFNTWNREEADLHVELAKIGYAKNELSRQIINMIRNEEMKAAEEEAAKAAQEAANDTNDAGVDLSDPDNVEE